MKLYKINNFTFINLNFVTQVKIRKANEIYLVIIYLDREDPKRIKFETKETAIDFANKLIEEAQ